MNIIKTVCCIATLSIVFLPVISHASDPFAEMDSEINSSNNNSSAQWQQKRADDEFANMEREVRGNREPERKPRTIQRTEPVQKPAQKPIIIVMPEPVVIERKAPTKTPIKALPAITNVQPTAAKKIKVTSSEKSIRTRDYVFELNRCLKSGNDVSCELIVTSHKQDKALQLYTTTRLFDNLGNEYSPTSIQIANTQIRRRSSISKQLIVNVPTKVTIVFRNVSTDALSIPKFDIKAYSQSNHFNIVYRNVLLASQ